MIFEKQIQRIYRGRLFNRCDDMGVARYFSAEDFPGLHSAPYHFLSQRGHTLKGCFYSYLDPVPGRVVVFDHGMGGGHRSYMREIERLAKEGYLVFAYDHTGCMESGGENTNGFAQSLADLDDCLTALKQCAGIQGRSISVVGHSWGGFSAMNICALHPDVSHVVALSGFVSVRAIVDQNFDGILKGYRKGLYAMEEKANPGYVSYCATQSLKATDAQVLLIYSADDPIVKMAAHYEVLRTALSDKGNVRMLLVDKKGHNPNYTVAAAELLREYQLELTGKLKKLELQTPEERKSFVKTFDWFAMTEQDETVWAEILKTLKQ